MKARRRLGVLGPALFSVVVVLAAISLVARWPHQFGGSGSKATIVSDFVSSGTATAPPLFVLVIFGIAAFAARRRGTWGTLATVALALLGGLMIVGSLGEGFAAPTPDVPRLVQYLSGGFGTIAGLLLISMAAAALRERRRTPIDSGSGRADGYDLQPGRRRRPKRQSGPPALSLVGVLRPKRPCDSWIADHKMLGSDYGR